MLNNKQSIAAITVKQPLKTTFILLTLFILAACSTTHNLASPPNIYSVQSPYPEQAVPMHIRTSDIDMLYITDRSPIFIDGELTGYTDKRSASMALGSVHVQYGDTSSWSNIVSISGVGGKKTQLPIRIENISEIERFPATPLLFTVTPKGPVLDPTVAAKYGSSKTIFKDAVLQQLSKSASKDVFLYVHGFNNSFEDSVYSLNDIWHYTGRIGVPIVYSWPSGSGNLLGYFTDRESGEFTIYHLKETLRTLFEMSEVANIHIISHSRGTDITTTDLRELVIETRAAGLNPREELRIKNLILAAPDLDYDIVKQRLIAEKFGPAFGKITIYMNENDGALGISQFLMRGVRFGRLIASKQGEHEDEIFKNVKNVTFINVKDVSGLIGHGYFTKHPGALSDIIRVLTTDSLPGSTERPLTHIQNNFWELGKNYLAPIH